MNEERLIPQKKESDFFFQNKIYDYSQKKLNELDRASMRKMVEQDPDRKKQLASVLMALEYLGELQKTKLNPSWVEEKLKKEKRIKNIINTSVLALLLTMIVVFGYLSYKVL